MLFQRGALQVSIFVEFKQSFGQAAVAHVLWLEEEVDDGGVVAALHVVVEVGLGVLHAGHQVVVEGEGAYLLQELFYFGMFVPYFVVDAEVSGGEGV